jgi:hypothetical protein
MLSPSSGQSPVMKLEAAGSSETLANSWKTNTQHHNPEDHSLKS